MLDQWKLLSCAGLLCSCTLRSGSCLSWSDLNSYNFIMITAIATCAVTVTTRWVGPFVHYWKHLFNCNDCFWSIILGAAWNAPSVLAWPTCLQSVSQCFIFCLTCHDWFCTRCVWTTQQALLGWLVFVVFLFWFIFFFRISSAVSLMFTSKFNIYRNQHIGVASQPHSSL